MLRNEFEQLIEGDIIVIKPRIVMSKLTGSISFWESLEHNKELYELLCDFNTPFKVIEVDHELQVVWVDITPFFKRTVSDMMPEMITRSLIEKSTPLKILQYRCNQIKTNAQRI